MCQEFKASFICRLCNNLTTEGKVDCSAKETTAPRRKEDCFPYEPKSAQERTSAESSDGSSAILGL